jgi:hypothetical protein
MFSTFRPDFYTIDCVCPPFFISYARFRSQRKKPQAVVKKKKSEPWSDHMFASPTPSVPNSSARLAPAVLLSEASRLIAISKCHAHELRMLELSMKQTLEELKDTVRLS